MKRFTLLFGISILLFCVTNSYAGNLHLEIQTPPPNSISIKAHPLLPNVFANLDTFGEITLWELSPTSTPLRVKTIYENASALELVSAAPTIGDTKFLVGTHYGELIIADSNGHHLCIGKTTNGADITHIVYVSYNSTIVTASADGAVNVWNDQCALIKTLYKHKYQVTNLIDLEKEKIILSSSFDGTILGFDTSNSRPLGAIRLTTEGNSFEGGVRDMAVSHESGRIAFSLPGKIELFETASLIKNFGKTDTPPSLAVLENANYLAQGTLQFVPGDHYITYSNMYEVHLWAPSINSDRAVLSEDTSGRTPQAIAFSKDGQTTIAGFENKSFNVWKLGYALDPHLTQIDAKRISGITVLPSNEIVAASEAGAVRLFSSNGILTVGGLDLKMPVYGFDASGDKKKIAVGGQGVITMTDLNGGQSKTWGLNEFNEQVGHIKFLPGNNNFIATSSFGTLSLFSNDKDSPLFSVPLAPKGGVAMGVAVSTSGKLIAVAMAGDHSQMTKDRIQLFRSDGTLLKEIVQPHLNDLVEGISFSPDDASLVSFSDNGQIRVWFTATGEPDGEPIVATDFARPVGVRFVNGAQDLLAAFDDGSVRIYSRRSNSGGGALLYEAGNQYSSSSGDRIHRMEMSADESLLVTGSEEGTISIWRFGFAKLFSWPQSTVETRVPPLFADGPAPLVCGTTGSSAKCWSPLEGALILPEHPELGVTVSAVTRGSTPCSRQS